MAKWTNRKFRPDYPDEDEFEFLEDGVFSFMADCGAKHAERIVSALNEKESHSGKWRQGSKVTVNIYKDDKIAGQFQSAELCEEAVSALNAAEPSEKDLRSQQCCNLEHDKCKEGICKCSCHKLADPVVTGDAVESAAEARRLDLIEQILLDDGVVEAQRWTTQSRAPQFDLFTDNEVGKGSRWTGTTLREACDAALAALDTARSEQSSTVHPHTGSCGYCDTCGDSGRTLNDKGICTKCISQSSSVQARADTARLEEIIRNSWIVSESPAPQLTKAFLCGSPQMTWPHGIIGEGDTPREAIDDAIASTGKEKG